MPTAVPIDPVAIAMSVPVILVPIVMVAIIVTITTVGIARSDPRPHDYSIAGVRLVVAGAIDPARRMPVIARLVVASVRDVERRTAVAMAGLAKGENHVPEIDVNPGIVVGVGVVRDGSQAERTDDSEEQGKQGIARLLHLMGGFEPSIMWRG